MKRRHRVAAIGMVVLMATAAFATSGWAATGLPTSQVLDTSKQVATLISKTQKLATADPVTVAALCEPADSSPVFARWADPALYTLAPQGDLASTTDWSFSRATTSTDHDPYSGVAHSVLLGSGGSAASPAVCIDATKPTIRFFARNTGAPTSVLRVDVLYEAANGNIRSLTVARLVAGYAWSPTIPVPIAFDAVASVVPSGNVIVSFRFAVEGGGGNWRVDGIYVDPWRCR